LRKNLPAGFGKLPPDAVRFLQSMRGKDAMANHRQMHLAVFWLGTGNHSAGWRMPNADFSNSEWSFVEAGARTAERGKFDLFFVGDAVTMQLDLHPSFITRLEPTTLLAGLARVTDKIGLGATVSTSFSEPYNVARMFSSIDHMSNGRAAWNVVTSTMDASALNFGEDRLKDHDLRYEIAGEFVDVVRGLWDTWDDGALVADKQRGLFVDPNKVRDLNHKGRFFSVKGALNIERCPQGHPIIIQAGGSEPGQELSARVADLVFTPINGDMASAKVKYESLKSRLPKYGRERKDLAILPGIMPVVGDSADQAREELGQLQQWLKASDATVRSVLTKRLGRDVSSYDLDAPIPELPETNLGQSFARTLLDRARREHMTFRDLYNIAAAARGHWAICGTATEVADILEEWFLAEAADGFMILPAHFPRSFDIFVDRVVPELQRRGLFKRDYSGTTLRDHLGLSRPSSEAAPRPQRMIS
jgi:FMN-dependent oxidoreductase (nitrilotriacetate monooxygenase family)